MTPVFGHGRLRLYLLKLLDESPRHGYEIIQQLRERFAGLYAPSAGTVYPRLARLESDGLIRHETDGGRKVYRITEAGRAELSAKAAELEALESEIRDSVRELSDSIRDEVRESARTVREELQDQTREAQRAAQGATRDAAHDGAASEPPFPSGPPPESAHWDRDQWGDWKRGQHEQWQNWKAEHKGQRDQWKDWQRAWKDQWARQWKEQWEEQQRRHGQSGPPPWASWIFGGTATDSTADSPSEPRDAQPQDAKSEGGRPPGRAEWERFGPQLGELLGGLRREAGPLMDAARSRAPLSEAELAEVRAVLGRTISELRDLFEGRRGDR
jgi:DNA-binding PadR family transcriptional regulator